MFTQKPFPAAHVFLLATHSGAVGYAAYAHLQATF